MTETTVPGSYAAGFEPPPLLSVRVPLRLRRELLAGGASNIDAWSLGEVVVYRFRDDAYGLQLSIGHTKRYPTWDEIKLARYRLLPANRSFGLKLPPPDEYVDNPSNRHVFQIVEWGS